MNLKKMKVISKKDIVALLIIFTIVTTPLVSVFASSSPGKSNGVSVRELAMFATIAYADIEKINNYPVKRNLIDNDIKTIRKSNKDSLDLTFMDDFPIPTNKQLSTLTTSTKLTIGKDSKAFKKMNAILGQNLNEINVGNLNSKKDEKTDQFLFYGLADTKEVIDNGWKLVNYTTMNTNMTNILQPNNKPAFTAMTFKRGNDVVIAYRGTDFDCIGDWLQDVSYGLTGRSGQELATSRYAITVAKKYPKANIYVTGHSLGGYLAQIGGAALIENGYGDRVKEIGYFNGMGLNFFSNITNDIEDKVSKVVDDLVLRSQIKELLENSEIVKLLKEISNNRQFVSYQNSKIATLKNWYKNGGKLVSYQINGDLVSALGTHCGKVEGFYSADECLKHHKDGRHLFDTITNKNITRNLLKLLYDLKIFNNDVSKFVDQYNPDGLLEFVWMTHETDSFFGKGKGISNIQLKVPSKIAYRKTAKATLIVETKGEEIINANKLSSADFSRSNSIRLSIVKVSAPKKETLKDGTLRYTYTITLKGKIVIGNTKITLKKGALKTKTDSSIGITSSNIRTKLR